MVSAHITLLGLKIHMGAQESQWQVSLDKAMGRSGDIHILLHSKRLLPTKASKPCGRLAYGRLARALIRPIKWRQTQAVGKVTLTIRLTSSLIWFQRALQEQWERTVPYHMPNQTSQAAQTSRRGMNRIYIYIYSLFWLYFQENSGMVFAQ